MVRYALYFTPNKNAPTWDFGCSVLGYDSVKAKDVPHPTRSAATFDQFERWSETPRR